MRAWSFGSMKEKKASVEDALHATRAAVEEDVVPGGVVALIRALAAPLREIVINAGEEASVVLNKVEAGPAVPDATSKTPPRGGVFVCPEAPWVPRAAARATFLLERTRLPG